MLCNSIAFAASSSSLQCIVVKFIKTQMSSLFAPQIFPPGWYGWRKCVKFRRLKEVGGWVKFSIVLLSPVPQNYNITKPQYNNTTIPQYHNITIPQYHNTTISQYHNNTLPQYHTTTISQYHNTTISQYHNINSSTILATVITISSTSVIINVVSNSHETGFH